MKLDAVFHYFQVMVCCENVTTVYNMVRSYLFEREFNFFGDLTSLCVPENRTLQKRLLNAIQTDEHYSNSLSSLCTRALSYHIALLMLLQSPRVLNPTPGTKTIE